MAVREPWYNDETEFTKYIPYQSSFTHFFLNRKGNCSNWSIKQWDCLMDLVSKKSFGWLLKVPYIKRNVLHVVFNCEGDPLVRHVVIKRDGTYSLLNEEGIKLSMETGVTI